MNWIKLHTGVHRNPKVRRAGRDARELFIFLLCLNGEHDFDGVIPVSYADPDYLAGELDMQRDATVRCIATACNAGLLHVDDCGNLTILGYDDEWRPKAKTSTQRSRDHRQKNKKVHAVAGRRNDKQRKATQMQRTVACNDEERRGEEIRSLSPGEPEEPEERLPFSTQALMKALVDGSGGLVSATPFDSRLGSAMVLVIRQCMKSSVTLEDVHLAGEYMASRWGDGREVGPKWVCTTGNLLDVVGKARSWDSKGRPAKGLERREDSAQERMAERWNKETA